MYRAVDEGVMCANVRPDAERAPFKAPSVRVLPYMQDRPPSLQMWMCDRRAFWTLWRWIECAMHGTWDSDMNVLPLPSSVVVISVVLMW